MNTSDTLIFAFSAIGSVAVIFFSRYCLRNHPKLSGEKIAQMRPDLPSIKFTYNLQQTVIALALFLAGIAISNSFGIRDMRMVIIFFPWFSGLAIFDGIFALKTHVYPTTSKANWDQFVLDEGDSLRWIAYSQIGLAALWIAVGLFVIQIFK